MTDVAKKGRTPTKESKVCEAHLGGVAASIARLHSDRGAGALLRSIKVYCVWGSIVSANLSASAGSSSLSVLMTIAEE